ncbi:MAG: hypothetical protein LR015_07955 [Verrucomicrobia bacterium]|nr:hypothetical protein [Verrucomicrobiota bacterium]
MSDTSVFSDLWHLVANQRIKLRPHVKVRRQSFRGEPWYVLSDPLNNRFYRFRPEAWSFIARLDGKLTVEEIWQLTIDRKQETAIGQQEVVMVLSQLFNAGLLLTDASPDAVQMFMAARKQQLRSIRAQAFNFLFLRIPLVDPDRWLNSIRWLLRLLVNPVMGLVWLLVMFWALKGVVEESSALFAASAGLLAPGNLLLLYLCWAGIKLFHEFGHAAVTKHFGGEVHTMGIMLLVFTPIPYMDASAAWDFPERRKRVLVGAAGMIFELFIAAIAFFVWRASGPGVVEQIAYNIMFLASVSTVLFNGNPLLRFDGYYILSDLLDVPNLHQGATRQAKYTLERHAFGSMRALPVARTAWGSAGYLTFLTASTAYRIFVLTLIILFIGGQIFEIGLVIAVYCIILWGIVPLIKFAKYLLTDPGLEPVRDRVYTVSGITLTVLFLLLAVVPFPSHFRSVGVVEARDSMDVLTLADGYLQDVQVQPGSWVEAGEILAVLHAPFHPFEMAQVQARLDENSARLRWAREGDPSFLVPLASQRQTLESQLQLLQLQQERRSIRAPRSGFFVSPEIHNFNGAWIERGAIVGTIVAPEALAFSAVVTQKEVSRIFSDELRGISVRFPGQAGRVLRTDDWELIAADQTRLPTAALGWLSGGSIQVQGNDQSGIQTTEPFFVVRVWLRREFPDEQSVSLLSADSMLLGIDDVSTLHLRRGVARFKLPPQPIIQQAWLGLRRLLQDRYQI